MATLTATLALTSAGATSESLGLTITDVLSTTNPTISVARATVETTGQFNILTTANSSITYVYIKNIDETNIITIKDDAGNNFLDLSAGEFAFLPVKGTIGLEATANVAPCVLEYGFWTKS